MSVRDIITDRSKLTVKLVAKLFDDTEITNIVEDLFDTARHHQNCIGLAANQIGYDARIFVMKYGSEFILVVNPIILQRKGETNIMAEGCLSRPGVSVKKRRHKYIKVGFYNNYAKPVQMKLRGIDARVFQHELDHLNGILI